MKNYIYDIHDNSITFNDFYLLTGKREDFLEKRINKAIYLQREQGHLYIYDINFIPLELYSKDNITYKCWYLDKKNNTILESQNSKFDLISSNNPLEYKAL